MQARQGENPAKPGFQRSRQPGPRRGDVRAERLILIWCGCGIRTRSPATNLDLMNTFRAIVFSSVIAGLVVGAIVTVIQRFGTVPLILRDETFEKAAEHHGQEAAAAAWQDALAEHSHAQHGHATEA